MIFKKFDSKAADLRRQILIERLHETIGTALGEAALCWAEPPQGNLDSKRSSKLLYKTVREVLNVLRDENFQYDRHFP